jgi:hypothetical protein
MAIPRPRMHYLLRYAQPRIPVYLSRAKDIKDAFKVCPTPDPCFVVEGQRHMICGFLAYREPNHQFFLPQEFTRSGGGLLDYPQPWMLLTPSQGGAIILLISYLLLLFQQERATRVRDEIYFVVIAKCCCCE